MFKLNRHYLKALGRVFALSVLLFISALLAQDPPKSTKFSGGFSSIDVAELLLGIIHFSRWPDGLKHLQLCIVGDSEHAEFLLNSELSVGEFVIDSQRVDEARIQKIINHCNVLFFGNYNNGQTKDLYVMLYGKPVLTIDERNEACSIGGMFCLSSTEDKLSFKINLDAIGRSQVRIHPGVLRLGQSRTAE